MARCCKYFTVSLVPVAALLLAVIFACGILTLPVLYSELAKKYEYGMVIDAGSSHTTVYLYRLGVPITGAVDEMDHHPMNSSSASSVYFPSLNSFADNTSGAGVVVSRLLQYATKSLQSLDVPQSLYNSTRVYLGATAGMRLLRRKNQTIAHEILKSAKTAIKDSGFKHKNTTIISGVEEAASGWTTANYIMKEKGLVGALDMGGASTEIAFSVRPEDNETHYHVTELLVGKVEHLYARSYLCYGFNEALGRFLAHLHSNNTAQLVNVSNPCLPKNFTKNYMMANIYTSCVYGSDAEEVFGFSLNPPLNSHGSTNVSFVGTGNISECVDVTRKVFDFYSCSNSTNINCDSGQYVVPQVNGTFVGFSGFQYIANHLSLDQQPFNRTVSLLSAVKEKCKNLTVSSDVTKDICFFGVFMAYMVEGGFGMNNSAKNNWTLVFKKMEGNISFGWSLGYFMNMTCSFPNHPTHQTVPFTAVDMVVGMVILTILCAVFVIFFFLTFYACKKALKTQNGYQSIS